MGTKFLTMATAALTAFSSVDYSQAADALTFKTGRIAISHDGNNWDYDDIMAFAMDWAVLTAFGLQSRLVHMEHSVIKCPSTTYAPKIQESAKGPDYFPGFDKSVIFDAWVNPAATVANFKAVAEKSSENDRLYFIVAGPMEIPYRDIQAVAKEKRKFITVISHSVPNDIMGACVTPSRYWDDMKKDFGPDGVVFTHLPDQNANLGGVGSDKWNPLLTLPANPRFPNPECWKWVKGQDYKKGDISDNGMVWWLLTGNDKATYRNYLDLFANPLPVALAIPIVNQRKLNLSQNAGSLKVTLEGLQGEGTIGMYNLLSQKVHEAPLKLGQANISLDGIKSGKYFLNLESNGQKFSKEVFIK